MEKLTTAKYSCFHIKFLSPYIYSSSVLKSSEILELPTPIVAIETKRIMTNSKFYGFPNTCPTVNVITSISA